MAPRPVTLVALMSLLAAGGPATASDVDDPRRALLRAIAAADGNALDRIARGPAGGLAGIAAVARIGTRDGAGAARAAVDAGFVTRWLTLGPLPGGAWSLDVRDPALDAWTAGAPATAEYAGLRGPVKWTPRRAPTGLLSPEAGPPGGRVLARTAVRLADGGDVIAWVYAGQAWRLWVDGAVVAGADGDPTLRRAEPVPLTLTPGLHRMLLVTHADTPPVVAVRLSDRSGRPVRFGDAAGAAGPHPVRLGALPGDPRVVPDPLAGLADDGLPAGLAPWPMIETPPEPEARFGLPPPRDPPAARTPPPPGVGPVWFPFVRYRLDVGGDDGLRAEQHWAAHIVDPAAADLAAMPRLDGAERRSLTVIRGRLAFPLARLDDARPLRAGDVLVGTARTVRRPGAVRAERPGPTGAFEVVLQAATGARVAVAGPPADVRGDEGGRTWRWRPGPDDGPVTVSTVTDVEQLAAALGRRLPPVAPRIVPPRPVAEALAAALPGGPVDDRWSAVRAVMEALADAGHRAVPVFARAAGAPDEPALDPAAWSTALLDVDGQVIDPTHPDGALPAAVQGAEAVWPGPAPRRARLTRDPPVRPRAEARGTLVFDEAGAGRLVVQTTVRGRVPLDGVFAATGGAVVERQADRLVVEWPTERAPRPGLGPESLVGAGPMAIDSTIDVVVPAGRRFAPPADVDLKTPAGTYRRSGTRVADGWRIERRLRWTGGPDDAFAGAVAEAERAPWALHAAEAGAGGER